MNELECLIWAKQLLAKDIVSISVEEMFNFNPALYVTFFSHSELFSSQYYHK